jgi:hypothetical protein
MVSIFNSPPPLSGGLCAGGGTELPDPLWPLAGEVSIPLKEGDTLLGGDVPCPGDESGERMGDGDLGGAARPGMVPGRLPRWTELRPE